MNDQERAPISLSGRARQIFEQIMAMANEVEFNDAKTGMKIRDLANIVNKGVKLEEAEQALENAKHFYNVRATDSSM